MDWNKPESICFRCFQEKKNNFLSIDEFFDYFKFGLNYRDMFYRQPFGIYEYLAKKYVNKFPTEWQNECVRRDCYFFDHLKIKTQEMWRIMLSVQDLCLNEIPENFRTPELYQFSFEVNPCNLEYFPEHMKTPKLCRLAVEKAYYMIDNIPENLKTPDLCTINLHGYYMAPECNLEIYDCGVKTDEMLLLEAKN